MYSIAQKVDFLDRWRSVLDCCLHTQFPVSSILTKRGVRKQAMDERRVACNRCEKHQVHDKTLSQTLFSASYKCVTKKFCYSPKNRFIWVLKWNLQQQLASCSCPDSCRWKSNAVFHWDIVSSEYFHHRQKFCIILPHFFLQLSHKNDLCCYEWMLASLYRLAVPLNEVSISDSFIGSAIKSCW